MSDHIGLPNDERYQRALEEFRTSFLKGQELGAKYMNFDICKIIFDDNYQVMHIE